MNIKSAARRAFVLTICVGPVGAWANSYAIVDLGTKMAATGIDADGEVSGTRAANKTGNDRAETYSRGALHKERSGGQKAAALAVSKGRVAGNIVDRYSQPVIWVRHGAPQTLALPGTAAIGTANAINTSGDVAGYFQSSEGGNHCFIWSFANGSSRDLGLLHKGQECEAYGIDNRGRVYGRAMSHPGYRWFAFVWRGGRLHRLPELAPRGYSMAVASNEKGDIVGWSDANTDQGYLHHAVMWRGGVPVDLTPKEDAWPSKANAINDAGTIVGQMTEYGGDGNEDHAVRFDPAGGWVELRDEVAGANDWGLIDATGISTSGVIVGWGTRLDGLLHGFMLIPQ
jgi:probable HAF family extracellular repeat protein